MAVYHGHYIDGGFTMLFYKQLLGKAISLNDMEEVRVRARACVCVCERCRV